MSIINYAVQIDTENLTVPDNTAYGFVGGVFRWVTGRPGYTGSPTYPTWEDGTNNTHVWFESWLLKDEMSDPTRKIDISESGDYGSFSSFDFKIRNDLLLWKWVSTEGIYFINRKIDLYVVIDGVFYSAWNGVISNNPYDEVGYEFTCVDQFQKIHKMIPPSIVDKNTFPDSKSDVQGDAVPVTIGNVSYSKLKTIRNEADPKILGYNTKFDSTAVEILSAAATLYSTFPTANAELSLFTPGKTYATDELKGLYVFVAAGGGDPDTDMMNRISSNVATTADITKVLLETPFEFIDAKTFNWKYAYDKANGGSYTPTQCLDRTSYPGHIYCEPIQTFTGVDCSYGGLGSNEIVMAVGSSQTLDLRVYLGPNAYAYPMIGHTKMVATGSANKIYKSTLSLDRLLTSNSETLTFYIREDPLDTGPYYTTGFHNFYATHNKSNRDTWWFSIVDMRSVSIISERPVTEIVKENGKTVLYRWSPEKNEMEIVSNLVLSETTGNGTLSGRPELELYNSNITKDGTIRYLYPFTASAWTVYIPDGRSTIDKWTNGVLNRVHSYSYLHDKRQEKNTLCDLSNRSSIQVWCGQVSPSRQWDTYKVSIDAAFPMKYINDEFDKIYLGVDFTVDRQTVPAAPTRFTIDLDLYDAYGNTVIMDDPDEERDGTREPIYKDWIVYPLDPRDTISEYYNVMMLPDEYYKGGEQFFANNLWGVTTADDTDPDKVVTKPFKTMMELPSDLVDKIRNGTTTNAIKITINLTSKFEPLTATAPTFKTTINLRQVGFVGVKTVSVDSDDFYVRLKGESFNGEDTSTVFKAFRLMLEGYDGIGYTGAAGAHYIGPNLVYNNLPSVRDEGWNCGRQLTERKKSYEYIKELASHSFVGIYPDRFDRRNLKAWIDDTSIQASYTGASIIRDSISDWKKTKVIDLYNDFRLQYDFNPATSKFDSVISVSNVDKNYFVDVYGATGAYGFPWAGATGTVVMNGYTGAQYEAWKDYVGGLSPASYVDAKLLWESANESYNRAAAVQPAPDRLSKLYWYSDVNVFNGLPNTGASVIDSAYKFLSILVQWTTRQKDMVTFSLPLSSANIVRELLDYITFADTVYTDKAIRPGWITSIKLSPKRDTIVIEATLEPENQIIWNIIDELGQLKTTTQHDESGTQTDQVDDGQDR